MITLLPLAVILGCVAATDFVSVRATVPASDSAATLPMWRFHLPNGKGCAWARGEPNAAAEVAADGRWRVYKANALVDPLAVSLSVEEERTLAARCETTARREALVVAGPDTALRQVRETLEHVVRGGVARPWLLVTDATPDATPDGPPFFQKGEPLRIALTDEGWVALRPHQASVSVNPTEETLRGMLAGAEGEGVIGCAIVGGPAEARLDAILPTFDAAVGAGLRQVAIGFSTDPGNEVETVDLPSESRLLAVTDSVAVLPLWRLAIDGDAPPGFWSGTVCVLDDGSLTEGR